MQRVMHAGPHAKAPAPRSRCSHHPRPPNPLSPKTQLTGITDLVRALREDGGTHGTGGKPGMLWLAPAEAGKDKGEGVLRYVWDTRVFPDRRGGSSSSGGQGSGSGAGGRSRKRPRK